MNRPIPSVRHGDRNQNEPDVQPQVGGGPNELVLDVARSDGDSRLVLPTGGRIKDGGGCKGAEKDESHALQKPSVDYTALDCRKIQQCGGTMAAAPRFWLARQLYDAVAPHSIERRRTVD